MERTSLQRKKHRDSRKVRKEKYQLSPSSSSSDSLSSGESFSESESETPKRRTSKGGGTVRGIRYNAQARTRSRSRSRSLLRGKICSGINEKPKESDLVMKVKWATTMLGTKHEVSFDQMTFDKYIMGETQILNCSKICDAERDMRIYLMKRIAKLNEKLGFSKSKELYREVLNSIEKGEFFWCNFYEIERLENEIQFNNMKVDDTSTHRHTLKSDLGSNDLKWCKDFDAGKYTFTTYHNSKFAGQVVKLHHICRVCWSKLKEKSYTELGLVTASSLNLNDFLMFKFLTEFSSLVNSILKVSSYNFHISGIWIILKNFYATTMINKLYISLDFDGQLATTVDYTIQKKFKTGRVPL